MGKLVDGQWLTGSLAHWLTGSLAHWLNSDKKGAFDRKPRSFRDPVSEEHCIYKPESGRYHLYVGYACPWAHRTLIYRHLKSLQEHISVSVVHPDMLEMGWSFDTDFPGATGDDVLGHQYVHQIYQQAQNDISTSATVPFLWDKRTRTIVNNESSDIIRIFN